MHQPHRYCVYSGHKVEPRRTVNHSWHTQSGWGCGQEVAGGFGAMTNVASQLS